MKMKDYLGFLSGIFDHPILNGRGDKEIMVQWMIELKKIAIETNIEYSKLLNINSSVATTTIKPSGTTSALVDSASGIHPRHSEYYIRHVRNDIKDPLTKFMIDQGVQWEKDVYDNKNSVVFKFPIKAPTSSVVRKELSAIEHLETWLLYQKHWTEHKPSVTISVKEEEWLEVGAWVYKNFDWVSGVSFLPYSDHIYTQAPFTECSKKIMKHY